MITVYAEKFDVGVKIEEVLTGFDYNGTKVTMANVETLKTKLTKDVKKKGVIYIDYKGEKYAITWGQGHMCTLKQAKDYDPAYTNWSKIPLPYFPSDYEIKVKDGIDFTTRKSTGEPDKWTVAQLNIIEKLFNSSKYIINATDDDREGELIFGYVYQYLNCTTPYKRVRLDSQTEKGFKKAFDNLIDGEDVKNVENAGRCRSISDWIVGANISSKMTLKYLKYFSDLKMITIGRIQTVVLDFIVEREKAIRSFVSHPFWYLTAEFTTASGEKYTAKHDISKIEEKEKAEEIMKKINGKQGTITSRDISPVTKEVPLLFNLPNLSREANKNFGFTAAQTLSIAQSLYEAGLITYPRTESECLTDDMMPVVDETLEMLKTVSPKYKEWIESVSTRNYTKRHFNTKKVESHYAIIPTTEAPKSLTPDQRKLYDLIAKSLIRIIFKPANGEKTNIVTEVEGEKFKSTGTVIVDPQWLIVDGTIDADMMPMVNVGDIVDGTYELKEGKTEPPKRYTDASLLLAMQSASKAIDDEELKKILMTKNKGGIGRPSTQGPIIENVVSKYCTRSGKQIVPTESAIKIIDILPVSELKSPELTAEWEAKLDKVEKGEIRMDSFISEMENAVKEWCKIIDEDKTELELPASTDGLTEYKCPKCGAPMRKYKWGWACSAYSKDEDSCKFAIGYNMGGAKLTDKEIEDILKNKRSSNLIHGFKKKDSEETYDAYIVIDENGNLKRSWETEFKCPKCGKPIIIGTKGWACSGWKEGCDFVIWDNFSGKKLTDKEKKQLLTDGKTGIIKGLVRKDGSKYEAALMLDENYKVTFMKTAKKTTIDESLRCPKCGKPINKGEKAWGCSGWKEGCDFVIWNTTYGKKLSEKDKEKLIKEGETDLINGFLKKDKTKFSAKLKLDENKKVILFWDKNE